MTSQIYIDSNIFISFFDGTESYSSLCKQLLYDVGTDKYQGYCSVLLFVEILLVHKKVQSQNELLFNLPGLSFIELNSDIALLAQQLRSDNPYLKAPDAIHLATALGQNCEYFISQDKKLNKIANKYLKSLTVEQFKG